MPAGILHLDEIERRVVAALQIDPRASWSQVAQAVGVSATTVARRAQRLLTEGTLSVVAVPHPIPCGMGVPVLVQVRAVPGQASSLAKRLAQRPGVRFVALIAGQTDIVCEVLVPDRTGFAEFLFDEIPREGQVVDVRTEVVLKTFKTTYDWSRAILGGKAQALDHARNTITRAVALDHADLLIIAALTEDGRRPYSELSEQVDLSETAIARRVRRLVSSGAMHFGTLIDPAVLGYNVEAFLRLQVDPASAAEIAETLARFPQVRYLAATIGSSDLVCEAVFLTPGELYEFKTSVLGKIVGLRQVEIGLELATVKRAFRLARAGSWLSQTGTISSRATRAKMTRVSD